MPVADFSSIKGSHYFAQQKKRMRKKIERNYISWQN